MRLLHVADIHLDTAFAGRPAYRAQLRQWQREAFVAAVDLALERDVAAMLIAGDLVDGDNLAFETMALVRRQLQRLLSQGIAVLYAHGNHDPAMRGGPKLVPEGVEEFTSMTPRTVTVCDRGGSPLLDVVGVGFGQKVERVNPLDAFPARTALPTVGLVHTQPPELGGGGTGFAPAPLSQMQALSYDYWALGHIHKRGTYLDGRAHYPGVLCGRDYSETGLHGVSVVTLEDGLPPRLEFVPLSPVQYADVTLPPLPEAGDLEGVYEAAFDALTAVAREAPGARLLARLTLEGEMGCYEDVAGPLAEENLAGVCARLCQHTGALDVCFRVGAVVRPLSPESYAGQPHLLSEALSVLGQAGQDDATARAVLQQLTDLGLYGADMGNAQEALRYLRQLLPGLDRQLCQSMVKEDESCSGNA